MDEFKFGDSDGLVLGKIVPKTVTFYLVTNDNLNAIRSKSVLSDIFTLLASLMWGAYFSVYITKKITLEPLEKELVIIDTLKSVFLIAGILFTILTIVFFVWNFNILKNIKRNEVKLGSPKEQNGN